MKALRAKRRKNGSRRIIYSLAAIMFFGSATAQWNTGTTIYNGGVTSLTAGQNLMPGTPVFNIDGSTVINNNSIFAAKGPNVHWWSMQHNNGTDFAQIRKQGVTWLFHKMDNAGRLEFRNSTAASFGRMFLAPNGVSGTINSVTGATTDRSGFVGIGYSSNTTTARQVPWTRLHLVDNNGSPWTNRNFYRPWMHDGLTISGYNDHMYLGHQRDDNANRTSAMLMWGTGVGSDRLSIAFGGLATNGGLGGASNDGLEFMRFLPTSNTEGLVGIGDFLGATDDPTERLDVRNGNVRVRDLPLPASEATSSPDWDRIVVVDPSGILKWRDESSITGSGIQNSCSTFGTLPLVDNIGGNGNLGCSVVTQDATSFVGISQPNPTQRLDVNGNINAQGFVNATNVFGGFRLGSTSRRVLAHGGSLGVGYEAGLNGDFNTSVGDEAGLNLLTTAVGNTNVGRYAGRATTFGSNNTFVGRSSGQNNTEGNDNTFAGHSAGIHVTTGIHNTVMGGGVNTAFGSGPTTGILNNTGTFGYNTRLTTSNSQRFGNDAVERWGFGLNPNVTSRIIRVSLPGPAPANTEAFMDVGGAWQAVSDVNMKTKIEEVDHQHTLTSLMDIPVRTWSYKEDVETKHMGPMAQDFYKAFGLGHGETTVGTIDLDGVAFSAIKGLGEVAEEQKATIEDQQQVIDDLQTRLNEMEDALSNCCTNYDGQGAVGTSGSAEQARLGQNEPNPFRERTAITYYVPSKATQATMEFFSMNGEKLRSEQLVNGTGQVLIDGGSFEPGAYVYSLIIDGKQLESKIMVLTK